MKQKTYILAALFVALIFLYSIPTATAASCSGTWEITNNCVNILVEETCPLKFVNNSNIELTNYTQCEWNTTNGCLSATDSCDYFIWASTSSSSSYASSTSIASSTSSSTSKASSSSSSSSTTSSSSSYKSSTSSSSSSSTSSMESSSSYISSLMATTTLADCTGDYTLACIVMNESECAGSFTNWEYTNYQCFWNDTGEPFCDIGWDGCTLGANPPCYDDEVEYCYEMISEESCESSYVEYTGEGVSRYNCQWIFGNCYEGYQLCDLALGECQSNYIFGCPIINNSRDCSQAYSVWEGYYYNCEWITDEGGDYCWFGDNCEKLIYDQCNAVEESDCYAILDEGDCNAAYVEGREGYGWNCVWYWESCYYAQDCHIGSPVTTTLAGMENIASIIGGMPPVVEAIVNFVIAIVPIIILMGIVAMLVAILESMGVKLFK